MQTIYGSAAYKIGLKKNQRTQTYAGAHSFWDQKNAQIDQIVGKGEGGLRNQPG